jgi:hypothetical protein
MVKAGITGWWPMPPPPLPCHSETTATFPRTTNKANQEMLMVSCESKRGLPTPSCIRHGDNRRFEVQATLTRGSISTGKRCTQHCHDVHQNRTSAERTCSCMASSAALGSFFDVRPRDDSLLVASSCKISSLRTSCFFWNPRVSSSCAVERMPVMSIRTSKMQLVRIFQAV